jgi:hypothetical protein
MKSNFLPSLAGRPESGRRPPCGTSKIIPRAYNRICITQYEFILTRLDIVIQFQAMRHNEAKTATAPTALLNVPHHHATQAPVGTDTVEQEGEAQMNQTTELRKDGTYCRCHVCGAEFFVKGMYSLGGNTLKGTDGLDRIVSACGTHSREEVRAAFFRMKSGERHPWQVV